MTHEPKKGDLWELKSTKFPGWACPRTPPRSLRLWHWFRKSVSTYPRSMPEETTNSKSDGILPEQVFDFVCSYAKFLHKKRELCNSNHLSSTTALFKSPLNKISFCEHDNLTHELCVQQKKMKQYSGTSIQGTPSGPRQVSLERRLGWGFLIINQQMKNFSFILSSRICRSHYFKQLDNA